MKKEYFKITLLSDIVLQATSNTEGKIVPLDFIPGSAILGIVAKNYNSFSQPFDVFHSGKIRFSIALPFIENQIFYKMPYSLFYEKTGDKNRCLNYHLSDIYSFFKQPKQKREGFINKENKTFSFNFNYTQKSAYDREKRRSKTNSMFGYTSLPENSEFIFHISYDKSLENEYKKIETYLINNLHRIGKSKSAEYGLVKIEKIDFKESVEEEFNQDILYCKSRIALFDANGFATFDLKYLCDGIEIDYEKTQIKTSTYTPFNSARKTKDYTRAVIEPGSVIKLKNKLTPKQKEIIKKGIGAYLSEGFGEILINPSFLIKKEITLTEIKKDKKHSQKPVTSHLGKFLLQIKQKEDKNLETIKKAKEFVKENKNNFKEITSSQWGSIRAILNRNEENYKEKIIDYISNGVKKWEDKEINIIKNFLNTADKELLKAVVILMQREKDE
jgi:hypothetical protein